MMLHTAPRRSVALLLLTAFLLQGCLVKRAARPRVTGYVYDADSRQPIEGCRVNESQTDASGYYELARTHYWDFTWIGLEAPPLVVQLRFVKPGYEDHYYEEFVQYGGSDTEAHWAMEPVFLQRIDLETDPVSIP